LSVVLSTTAQRDRPHLRVDREPAKEYGDVKRFGWTEDDEVTIGELPP
jgi:hypothetical protein